MIRVERHCVRVVVVMSRFATDQSTDESDGSSDFHDVDFRQPALKRSLSEKGLELLNKGYSELDIPATLVFPEKLRRQVSYYFGAGASSRLAFQERNSGYQYIIISLKYYNFGFNIQIQSAFDYI